MITLNLTLDAMTQFLNERLTAQHTNAKNRIGEIDEMIRSVEDLAIHISSQENLPLELLSSETVTVPFGYLNFEGRYSSHLGQMKATKNQTCIVENLEMNPRMRFTREGYIHISDGMHAYSPRQDMEYMKIALETLKANYSGELEKEA